MFKWIFRIWGVFIVGGIVYALLWGLAITVIIAIILAGGK